MSKSNDQRLQEIAAGMQSLNERLVYLGGALAGSYATDSAATVLIPFGQRSSADDRSALPTLPFEE